MTPARQGQAQIGAARGGSRRPLQLQAYRDNHGTSALWMTQKLDGRAFWQPRSAPPARTVDGVCEFLVHRAAPLDPVLQAAVRARLGWDGQTPSITRAVEILAGTRAGTRETTTARERIRRRILFLHKVAGFMALPWAIKELFAVLHQCAPAPESQVTAVSAAAGLTEGRWSPESLLLLAGLFGVPNGLQCFPGLDGETWLITAGQYTAFSQLKTRLMKLGRTRSVVRASDLPKTLSAHELQLARHLLGFPRSDPASGACFAVGGILRRPTIRCLGATGPLNSRSLHEGLRRDWRGPHRVPLPALDHLEGWLERQPEVRKCRTGKWDLQPGTPLASDLPE